MPPLPPTSSEKLTLWRRVKKFVEYDPPAIATPQSPSTALGNGQEKEIDGGKADPPKIEEGESEVATHLAPMDSDANTVKQHGLDHPAGYVSIR